MEVRSIVLDKGFKSIIIVPSQIDSRRTWMTFNKVFKDDEIKIISLPSHYQSFSPEGWWKDPGWVRELIFEYQTQNPRLNPNLSGINLKKPR